MIYIPIELQLQWIREDLNYIKSHICNYYPMARWPNEEDEECSSCVSIRASGLSNYCSAHAPEYNMRIDFPL